MAKIRPIKKEDADVLFELFKQLNAHSKRPVIEDLIDDSGCHCIILEHENGELIGFGSLIVHQVPTKGWVGRIEDIIVHESHRGGGHGRKIMEELISLAREKEISILDLTSNPSRIPARTLYESLGFKLRDTGVFRLEL